MFYYLRNPSGRVVTFDTENDYKRFSLMSGFEKLSEGEIKEYEQDRFEIAERYGKNKKKEVVSVAGGWKKGVYFVTVNQDGKDGYGTSSNAIFDGLKDCGVNVSRSYDGQKVGLIYHAPYSRIAVKCPVKVIYTMFESTKIPDEWVEDLKAVDKVLVPSKWCKDVFRKSGIEAEVLPLGYDDKIYKYIPRKVKDRRKEPFVFLHYNAFNLRKGFAELFSAFTKEFKPFEPVKLILKTTLNSPPIPINLNKYPNIEIICEKYGNKEMMELMARSDCFVFPSRGEGFGMTPLEAMATGIPAIVPNAHGISEYFNPEFMYEVKVSEECPAIYKRYKNQDVGKMVVCDVNDLRKKMRYVYEHPDEALEKGRLACGYAGHWTLAKTALKLRDIIEDLYNKDVSDKPNDDILNVEAI